MTSRRVRRLLSPLLLSLAFAAAGQAAPPTAEQIDQAIVRLADDSFVVREQASMLLWRAGRRAKAALEKATHGDDAERVHRARAILAKFDVGIYPDTSPEVVELIRRFLAGDMNERQQVFVKLAEGNHTETLLGLLQHETSEENRKILVGAIGGRIQTITEGLIANRDYDRAEQWLRLATLGGNGIQDYAVVLILQGKANDEIARLHAATARLPGAVETRLLLELLKIKGDLPAARQIAEQIHNEDALHEILFAQRDWNAICQRRKAPTDPSMEDLSYDAAYFRLGGREQEFQRAVKALRTRALAKPDESWFCCEALMINDRFDDAVEINRKLHPLSAFELLVAQGKYGEAFAAVGIQVPLRDGPITSVKGKAPDGRSFTAWIRDLGPGILIARTLYRLGEKERALELLNSLAPKPDSPADVQSLAGRNCLAVAEVLFQLGEENAAFAQAARPLAAANPPVGAGKRRSDENKITPAVVFSSLFGVREATAEFCWEHLRRLHGDEPVERTLSRIRRLVWPKRQELAEDGEFKQFLGEIEKDQLPKSPPAIINQLRALAELHLARKHTTQARYWFQEVALKTRTGGALMLVADLYAEDNQWKTAADFYQRAAKAKYKRPLAIYLRGSALAKAGEVKEGETLMKQARLMPLANRKNRTELAQGLADRDLDEAALEQWRLLVNLGSIRDWDVNNACKELGNAISDEEPLQAANCWEQFELSALSTNTTFFEVESYLYLPHLIHKARARGLLAAGKLEAATRELWLSHAALPGDSKFALTMVPKLRKAGMNKTADELFEKTYAVLDRATRDFPKSAQHHNEAAWLAARCERRLDEALQHATEAVRLRPDSAAFLDTLAEAHFARGDKQKAIELEHRCLEMQPGDSELQEQLRRFEGK